MKQPLMLPPTRIPPAQAEALYDTSPEENGRSFANDTSSWPGEDWDEDAPPSYHTVALPERGRGRIAQH
jgi:hypothetical protein